MKNYNQIQIHGHRGCRGLLTENTIDAFQHAIKLGVDAIEADVVITADNMVLVSHEPWFSHEYCLDRSGIEISPEKERSFNIFKMKYDDVRQFDCGIKRHPRFPFQKNFPAYKPLLADVIDACLKLNSNILFNIEIKSEPLLYNSYQPEPPLFVDKVINVIRQKQIEKQVLLQSFDMNILRVIHKTNPGINSAFLTENDPDPVKDISKLGFKPYGYNPLYKLLTVEIINYCHENNVQVLTWTVNETADMKCVAEMGVDGIITDYPDRALNLFRSNT